MSDITEKGRYIIIAILIEIVTGIILVGPPQMYLILILVAVILVGIVVALRIFPRNLAKTITVE